jgi:hypothetical protein
VKFLEKLRGSSDRAAAIVGASLVELSLTDAVLAHLHSHPKITKELLSYVQPLPMSN